MSKAPEYILFLDESGKTGILDVGPDSFLLSGLILDKDLHSALSSYMLSLKEKFNIPADENIHAFDLFEAERRRNTNTTGGKHRKIPYSHIDSFFKTLSHLINGTDIHSLILIIDKQIVKDKICTVAGRKGASPRAVLNFLKRENLNDFLYETLARKMILEFAHFLEQNEAHGEVVAESRRDADGTVLRAFMTATNSDTFVNSPRYSGWARTGFNRIHSLTFQNKKGLSFGLEIADLFGWAYFHRNFGSTFPVSSVAKGRRIQGRISEALRAIERSKMKKPETISLAQIKNIAADRFSEFTDALARFKA